ncbi:uncharacterized protein CANTADRAFT_24691 [Suhomyces tanzawaensis NRRL Y-17324]|uniref:DNA replication factor Cdt1 C-terminal domain-containing protein n=1 Tax=Suhomyces tanzawaensis NRRL Y-17324 TaxID=984487 RepID=A0A1E4SRB8_9ASCO|nr:uncharacterized protein CANTADRAFT_24691 [Suhomyces tanzawaensis NRRL Y-17324]ODV81987.1 hypothetical protein CANTADRAFT_24691 [Suhomyces tanzawaensis NRRL Y-17324]
MDKIPNHPTISSSHFMDLHRKFCAIDNTLTLHYTAHNVDPLLVKILDSSATLAQCRIQVLDVEIILLINPEIFSIYKTGSNNYDYTKIFIKFPSNFNQGMIQTRKEAFAKDIENWILQNKDTQTFFPKGIPEILKQKEQKQEVNGRQLPNRITKITRKSSLADLKNDSSKFKFQERIELIEQQKSNGMSLLERIKLKEKLRKEQLERENGSNTPEVQYEKYLVGKFPQIYDMVYHMSNTNRGPGEAVRTFSCQKLCATIVNSHDYPLNKKEVEDAIKLMSKKLGDKFVVLERGGVTVLKVGILSREDDLKVLASDGESISSAKN